MRTLQIMIIVRFLYKGINFIYCISSISSALEASLGLRNMAGLLLAVTVTVTI